MVCFGEKAMPFRRNCVTDKKSFRSNLPTIIAPIVAAARCFVSEVGMQRLQRIAGRRWNEKRMWASKKN
ncbi:MAG: hypothetical protein WCL14_05870 [Bacteroidota bacterium]